MLTVLDPSMNPTYGSSIPRSGGIQKLLVALFVFAAAAAAPSVAQQAPSVDLLYRESGFMKDARTIAIALSDRDGTVPPDTAQFRSADRVYFRYTPKGDWALTMEDIAALQQIKIKQGETLVQPSGVRMLAPDTEQSAALVGVPKDTLNLGAPVVFSHAAGTSAPLSVDEAYLRGYASLHAAWKQAQAFMEEKRPRKTIIALHPFVASADSVERLSFTPKARALLDTAVVDALDRVTASFETLQQLPDSITTERLVAIDTLNAQLQRLKAALQPYVQQEERKHAMARRQIDFLAQSVAGLQSSARSAYRDEQFRILQRGTFASPRLGAILDGLMYLLLDPARAVNDRTPQLDTLRTAPFNNATFAPLRQRLEAVNSWAHFQNIVQLVNANIANEQRVFGDIIMQNLRLRRPAAPRPYYEVMAGMNALGRGEQAAFEEAWTRALAKATASNFIHRMQQWSIVSNTAPERLSQDVWADIAAAQALQAQGQLQAAQARYEATRQRLGPFPVVDYALGDIALAQADTAAARKYFNRAHVIDDTYVPPTLALIELAMAEQAYPKALVMANEALQDQPYWTIYFRKGQTLVRLERLTDAIDVLRSRCEPLNNNSVALYTLLTDIYIERKMWEGAKWALDQARKVNPDAPAITQRAQRIRAALKNPDSVSASETPPPVPADTSGSAAKRPADTVEP
ncbi:tetratricopeptide repeat protein [Salisaeta longa]|uniref:tetratricopeptide repeat protein n=1 Tax=Salisaeta longa TaxID=503170 RepID=UPI0003B69781|nr:hypothetical protein [Salisaeta longa]